MTAEIINFDGSKPEPVCAFCKTPRSKVKRMVAGTSGKHICDKCIIKCKNLIEKK
jgi:hypothetical protein